MSSTLEFLHSFSKGYKLRLGVIVFIGLIEVGLSLVFVWMSKAIIDIATGYRSGDLVVYGAMLIGIMACQIALRLVGLRLARMTEVKLGNKIRYDVFSRLLYSRWEELSAIHSGDMLTRLIKDTNEVVNVLVTSVPVAITATTQFIGAVVVLYILDPKLAIILGVCMPVLMFFGRSYYVRMRKYTHEIKASESMITSMMQESLLNQIVLRTFERQEHELDKLDDIQSELHGSVEKRTNVSVVANMIMSITFNGGYITAFLWSVYGLAKKQISFGTVTAYLQLVNRIQRPLFDLIRLLPTMVSAKTSIERLTYLTGFDVEDVENKILLDGNVRLRIEDISFAYSNDSKKVISDFSMEVDSGSMVAITGETGIGKTTLFRLLLGLVQPTNGSIKIENELQSVDISERTRSNFVYVPQGGSLFSGTIRENILFGDSEASDADIERVLRIASAGFVFDLPDGIDTVLGENGAGLSEGQGQRIAIARAMLRPGKIVLLDEATSALDVETARRFMHNLKENIGDKMVLFITHQREVIDFCDYEFKLTT
ncbi:MAG: ABC transporter ATP-binding protein [Fermentimonas sp.]|jgi:ATP-binding cassette subfamily B protein